MAQFAPFPDLAELRHRGAVWRANYQKAKVPDFAHDLDPEIFQLHSIDYRNPHQLRAGPLWCTGFHPGFSWIDLPIHGDKEPTHERGIVANEPGFYFVGLHFLYSSPRA